VGGRSLASVEGPPTRSTVGHALSAGRLERSPPIGR